MVTFLLALACSFAAMAAVTWLVLAHALERWDASSRTSAAHLAETCATMLMPVDAALARRIVLATTLGVAGLASLLGGGPWQQLLLAVAGAGLGYHAPALVLRLVARRRLHAAGDQLGQALVLMASGLQAGLSLQQALELAVRESPSPLADELALILKDVHLGTPFDEAMRQLPRRLPLDDVQLAVDAILTLRQTGGDLVSSFRLIADTIAERMKVEGRIRVITAEGMLQGIVMCLIPPVMLLLFAFSDPQAVRPLLGHPIGWAMLAVVAALNGTGFVLMRKVARVRV